MHDLSTLINKINCLLNTIITNIVTSLSSLTHNTPTLVHSAEHVLTDISDQLTETTKITKKHGVYNYITVRYMFVLLTLTGWERHLHSLNLCWHVSYYVALQDKVCQSSTDSACHFNNRTLSSSTKYVRTLIGRDKSWSHQPTSLEALTLKYSLTLTLTVIFTDTHTLTHPHTRWHPHTHSLTLTLILTHTHSLSHSHSLRCWLTSAVLLYIVNSQVLCHRGNPLCLTGHSRLINHWFSPPVPTQSPVNKNITRRQSAVKSLLVGQV